MRPERPTLRRVLALVALGLAAGAWLIARPTVLAAEPWASFFEFPVGLFVVTLLCWTAARPARARERPRPPWRRHEQIVRTLLDPEAAALEARIAFWIETGDGAPEAADTMARALATDARRRGELRADLVSRMTAATSRRKRESFLRQLATSTNAPGA